MSNIEKVNQSNWDDWTFESLSMDFDSIKVIVTDIYEKTYVSFLCKAYIGLEFIGHWDESEIRDITIEKYGQTIDKSLDIVRDHYGETPSAGGGERLIDAQWMQLNVTLIDGLCLKVACMDIDVKIK